jgi:uncharacterized protein (TIRG00374 family)
VSKRLQNIIGLGVFALFAVYFFLNLDNFKPLLDVNVALLGVIALCNIAAISANGLFIKFILQPFGKHISVAESVYVSLISSVGNFFAPVGGGLGFRAVYLKKKHGLPYSEYLSTLSGNYIIVFLVNSFFGLLSLFLLRERTNAQYAVLVAIFGGLFLVTLVLSLIKLPALKGTRRLKNKYLRTFYNLLIQITGGWNRIVSNKRLMVQLIGITAFNFLLMLTIARLIMASLHFEIGTAELLLFCVLGSLSVFVNITPANLGVKEAIYIFSASVIGFSINQIILIALIDRGVLFITLVFLWFFTSRGTKKYSSSTATGG